jgi:hypothetical protein
VAVGVGEGVIKVVEDIRTPRGRGVMTRKCRGWVRYSAGRTGERKPHITTYNINLSAVLYRMPSVTICTLGSTSCQLQETTFAGIRIHAKK